MRFPAVRRYIWLPLLAMSALAFFPANFGQGRIRDFFQYLPFFAIGLSYFQLRRGDRVGVVGIGLAIASLFVLCRLQSGIGSVPFNLESVPIYLVMMGTFVVFAGTNLRLPWVIETAVLFVAAISYPLYLLHQDVGLIIEKVRSPAAAVAFAFAAAAVIHFLVERKRQYAVAHASSDHLA
jgi:peptidoglycan/LPS O-acetylase OafA/YrhL